MKLRRTSIPWQRTVLPVVLSLVVSLTVTSCSLPWQAPAPSEDVSSETSLTSEGGTIEIDGARVQAVAGTAPEGTRLAGDFQEEALPSALGDEFQAASKPLSIQLGDGLQPQKPLTVTIPIDRSLLEGFDESAPALAVMIITEGNDKPDLVQGSWDSAAGTVTAKVPHLSIVQAIHFDAGKWVDNIKATMLQSLALEYPKPACADDTVTIAGNTYSAVSQWAEWTCLSNTDGSLTATAHSNSPIPFMVTSKPAAPGRITTDFSRSGVMTAPFANALGFSGTVGQAIMFAGGSTEFTFDHPADGASLAFSELPEILLLSVLTQSLDEAFDKFGQKLHLDKLSGMACWGDIVATSLDPTLSVETASGMVKSVLSCAGQIAELTAVGNVVLLLVGAAPAAFAGMFIGLVTSFTGDANFEVQIDKLIPQVQLKTFTDQEMGISFQYPAEWSVSKPTDPRFKTGAEVLNGSGVEVASVNFNTSFDFAPCTAMKPYQLIDSTPVTIPGMDTSAAPTTVKTELVDIGAQSAYWPDKKPLRLGIALYSNPGQPPEATEVCNAAGLIQSDGKFGFFSADRGFDTVQEAEAFLATREYEQIKAMLASMRFL